MNERDDAALQTVQQYCLGIGQMMARLTTRPEKHLSQGFVCFQFHI